MGFALEDAKAAMGTAFPEVVQDLKIVIESVTKDGVQLRLPLDPRICREGDIVSGQALSMLADTSMVYCIWAAIGARNPVGTVDLHVTFLRPAAKSDVLARAEVVRLGRTLAFARVTLLAAASLIPVATAIGTFALPP
jgi:uncharacterized protein (TIGR00369 family)